MIKILPYIYIFKWCIIYKRITTNIIYTKILYKLDTFNYKIITHQFETDKYTNSSVNEMLKTIIDKLNSIYK